MADHLLRNSSLASPPANAPNALTEIVQGSRIDKRHVLPTNDGVFTSIFSSFLELPLSVGLRF